MTNESDIVFVEGSVESITYRNDSNGYTVLQLNSDSNLLTAVGILPQVSCGDLLRLKGEFVMHKIYGSQFSFTEFESLRPQSTEAILKYLSSGAIKGIGPATALKMVNLFGENTLDVIENDPDRLTQIKGISADKANNICEQYSKMFGMREMMIHLSQYGITPDECTKIYKEIGAGCVDKIFDNPYLLFELGIGFSFERIERIARLIGIEHTNPHRQECGILHVLKHNLYNGHTCLPKEKVILATSSFLNVDKESISNACDLLIVNKKVFEIEINNQVFLQLPRYFNAEKYISGRIKTLLQFPPEPVLSVDHYISAIELANKIKYENMQKDAIKKALTKGVLILTGGPGTGKTTTLKAMITIMLQKGMNISLAAPTGRAAKRITELTGFEAKTIHRLLEVEYNSYDKIEFMRNERNPLESDAIIVDELSMIDTVLFEALLKAMRLGCRLIMVGDKDQLPAVGAGNILGDLIESKKIPTVCLDTIFRQAMQSTIITNAHKIVAGEYPVLDRIDSDFFLVNERNVYKASKIVADLCCERLPKAYGFDPFKDIQLLCPSKKGMMGTSELNQLLHQRLNPPEKSKAEIVILGKTFRIGDKVIQTKNNYEIAWTKSNGDTGSGIFNGDIGIIVSIDKKACILSVQFDDRIALYTIDDAEKLEPAYAITVHKSQGSEYECVVMPVLNIPQSLCYRNLLYTGVTRAKRIIVLVGSSENVNQMVDNNKKTLRYTALLEYMK